MITFNGWWAGGEGEGKGEISVQSIGRRGNTSVETFSNLFVKKVVEGAVTTEAGGIFQYFTSLTEKGLPLYGHFTQKAITSFIGLNSNVITSFKNVRECMWTFKMIAHRKRLLMPQVEGG